MKKSILLGFIVMALSACGSNKQAYMPTSTPIVSLQPVESVTPILSPALENAATPSSIITPSPTPSQQPIITPKLATESPSNQIVDKVNVVNEWKGTCFNRPCIFYAGVMKDDPKQGVLIQQYPDEKGISLYPTPRKHGAIRIVKEDSTQFSLLAEDGTNYGFDNAFGKYVRSSETLPLSFKPGIFFPDSDLKALKGHEVELKTAMNIVHALSERNLTLFKEQFINPEAAQQAGYTINDPSIVYAFHHIEYWGNVEDRGERCIIVHAHAGDQVNGKEDEKTMVVCMQQNDQKQWKVYMID